MANVIVRVKAIIRIVNPIVIGFKASNRDDVIIINIDSNINIIYNYKICTYSINFKNLCALYT